MMSSQDRERQALTRKRFEELYYEYGAQLRAYLCSRLNGDMALADDMVQEAFIRAWDKRHSLRSTGAFKSWLYSIALNVLRQHFRRPRLVCRELQDSIESSGNTPEEDVCAAQARQQVREAMSRLSDDQREAVLLVRFSELTYQEAADVLGAPVNTVKTWVRRGLLKLADELEL